MSEVLRGTTPTFTFTIPFNTSTITKLSIAFSQNDTVIIEKTLSDCTLSEKVISATLTESDTLKLDSDYQVELQLRVACGTSRLASKIIKLDVDRILKDGAL